LRPSRRGHFQGYCNESSKVDNKVKLINLSSRHFVESGIKVVNCSGDADSEIVQVAIQLAKNNASPILVVAEDTYCIVMLCVCQGLPRRGLNVFIARASTPRGKRVRQSRYPEPLPNSSSLLTAVARQRVSQCSRSCAIFPHCGHVGSETPSIRFRYALRPT
jgi:hypothetical protein